MRADRLEAAIIESREENAREKTEEPRAKRQINTSVPGSVASGFYEL